jgi:hypothetical protein
MEPCHWLHNETILCSPPLVLASTSGENPFIEEESFHTLLTTHPSALVHSLRPPNSPAEFHRAMNAPG